MTRSKFFGNINFTSIADDPSFKEASVRSFIIDLLIKKLGYTAENIVLEKTIQIQTGSKKQTKPYYADYALKIGSSFVCTIEAKSPKKNLTDSSLIDQAFSYASHREIRSNYFALCNGLEFALFRTDLDRTLLLHFSVSSLSEEDANWKELKRYLSPESFHGGKPIQYEKPQETSNGAFDKETYCRKMLLEAVQPRKQAARRHFGCNAYFTRQTWNVVAEYIKNYTRKGDTVLDPYGGSGITAVEALMNERKAIHIDINPLSKFIVDSLLAPVSIAALKDAFESVCEAYRKNEPKTKKEIKEALQKYKQPKDWTLPQDADVKSVWKLFTPKQRAQLSLLKHLIKKQKDKNIRQSLLLAFHNTVGAVNRTQHRMPRGVPINFVMYYRYRIAPDPANLSTLETFIQKFKRIHKDPDFWHLIINTAERCGFEYVGAVSQKNGQTSFKKRQRPWKTLSGQLIINFRKVRNPKTLMKANLGSDMTGIVLETIEGIIAKHNGATLEQINDGLILKGMELGFLDLLSKQFSDLTPLLQKDFRYDTKSGLYTIPENRSFKTHIDLHLRIKYYLMSILTRYDRQNEPAHFDDIVLSILPSLKNGDTPESQTILSVLEDIGERYGEDCWRLKPTVPNTPHMF